MQALIYYPDFEVTDDDWLKFALLYLEKLRPIIPTDAEEHLSDKYRFLMHETDLIVPYRPEYQEGELATLDAIAQIERILRNPRRYEAQFQQQNFLAAWKNPENHRFQLFQGKYAHPWEEFCVANNFARQSDEGLQISDEISRLYMTILAHVISDSSGISAITDSRSLDRFAVFMRHNAPDEKKTFETAKGILELHLPANLSDINLSQVIAHRERRDFKAKQKAFHRELNEFLKQAEEGKSPEAFAQSLGNVWSDFKDNVLQVGSGTLAFGVGVWLLLDTGGSGDAEILKEIAGGLSLVISSSIALKNTWRHTRTSRYTRKYLTDLSQLGDR